MTRDELIALFEERIEMRGASAREIARQAGFDMNIIKNFRRNRSSGKVTVPSFENLQALCAALGLDFYIGPPRENELTAPSNQSAGAIVELESFYPVLDPDVRRDMQSSAHSLNRAVLAIGGDPIPEDLWPKLAERLSLSGIPVNLDAASDAHAPKDSLELAEDILMVDFAEDVRTAAGSGAIVFEEAAFLQVAVPRSVLPRWVSTQGLICIRAVGDSMEPTLSDGHLILLDRSQIEPVDNKVFVIHTDDGLVVKRVRKMDDGWQMTSDNPDYKSRPLGEWDRNVGRVAWSGPLPATEAGG